MASLQDKYEKESKTQLDKINQLSQNSLLKQQFDKQVKQAAAPSSDLQKRADTYVQSVQSSQDKIVGGAPGGNGGKILPDAPPPTPSVSSTPGATPSPTPTPTFTPSPTPTPSA